MIKINKLRVFNQNLQLVLQKWFYLWLYFIHTLSFLFQRVQRFKEFQGFQELQRFVIL